MAIKTIIIKTRSAILVFLTHKIALPMLKIFRKTNTFPYSVKELENFPAGSLGNDLFIFLKKRNLSLLKHYSRHDLKHVLLEYDTTDEGEACLQTFMLGNGRISFPVLATVLYSIFTMPEHWSKMKQAYRKGKKANPVHTLSWQYILAENTTDIRKRIFLQTN